MGNLVSCLHSCFGGRSIGIDLLNIAVVVCSLSVDNSDSAVLTEVFLFKSFCFFRCVILGILVSKCFKHGFCHRIVHGLMVYVPQVVFFQLLVKLCKPCHVAVDNIFT